MRILSLLLLLPILGCTSVVMSTVAVLNDLDPMTADPAGFEVAIDLPEGVSIKSGTALLTLTSTRGATGEQSGGTYALEERSLDLERLIYALSEEQIQNVREMQASAAEWEADGTNILSMEVTFYPCLIDIALVTDDPRFSISVRLAENAPHMPLVRNARVQTILEATQWSGIEDLDSCTTSESELL